MSEQENIASMGHPIGWVMICTVTAVSMAAIDAYGGLRQADSIQFLGTHAIAFSIIYWVYTDSLRTKYRPTIDYEWFMYLLMILLLPHYLYKTRGMRGLFLGVGLTMLTYAPSVIAEIVNLARHGPN
jgi:hypothetical protein